MKITMTLEKLGEMIQNLEKRMDYRFDGVEERFKGVDKRFDKLENLMEITADQVQKNYNAILDLTDRVDGVDSRLNKIGNRVGNIESTMATKEDIKLGIYDPLDRRLSIVERKLAL